MVKPAKKQPAAPARRGGSTFLGIMIGLVLGLFIALGVAWYINKLPNPFRDKATPPKPTAPAYPTAAPKVSAPPAAEQPKPPVVQTPAKEETSPVTAEKKSTPAARDTFFLQTGSFQDIAEAETLKARLALLGLEAAIQARNLPDKGVWHRVRVGPYTDVEELNRVRDILKQNSIEVALVKVREP
jgi:cell division protein FtsN